MDTPSQKLGARIVARLVSEKILDAEAGKKLLPKLEAGKLRPEDWRLPIETAGTTKGAK
jgi:hypothetical protein